MQQTKTKIMRKCICEHDKECHKDGFCWEPQCLCGWAVRVKQEIYVRRN